jgi:hypothetical protein
MTSLKVTKKSHSPGGTTTFLPTLEQGSQITCPIHPWPDHESMRENLESPLQQCLPLTVVFSLTHTQQSVLITTSIQWFFLAY